MSIEHYRAVAARALAAIQPPGDQHVGKTDCRRLPPAQFRVPDLVRYALTRLVDLKDLGRGEKVAWSIDARFCDLPFQIALRKFGFQVCVPEGTSEDLLLQLIRSLQVAAKLAARSLADFAAEQVEAGNVTIENQYRIFDGAYRFFRQEATDRYQKSPNGRFLLYNTSLSEAGYCAGAMLNAYFSRLEHVLVLILPFTCIDLTQGGLRRFASDIWQDKFKTLFKLHTDATAKRIHDVLKDIKDTFRNPISHGGFDKKETFFYFHVAGIAALPARLTGHDVCIEHYSTLITKPEFERLCQQLDECDTLLDQSTIGLGVRYVQTGLPTSFSTKFRTAAQEAARSSTTFEEFMERQMENFDRHVNMDY